MSRVPPASKLLARRLALLASAAGLGAILVFAGPDLRLTPAQTVFGGPAHAQGAERPVGFADIVEKVKPAVISVRVKMDAGPEASGLSEDENPFGPNSPFRYFFRRFGGPDI